MTSQGCRIIFFWHLAKILQVAKLWSIWLRCFFSKLAKDLSRQKPDSAHKLFIFFHKPFDPFTLCFLTQEKCMARMQEKNSANSLIRLRLQSVILHSNDTHPNVPPRNHATATASAGFPITKLKSILWPIHRPSKANLSQRKIHRKTPQICIISTWLFYNLTDFFCSKRRLSKPCQDQLLRHIWRRFTSSRNMRGR